MVVFFLFCILVLLAFLGLMGPDTSCGGTLVAKMTSIRFAAKQRWPGRTHS
jgi:hypothetical protein